MINEKIYQYIFDEISAFLPAKWEQVVIYLEYGEGSYTFKFYVRKRNRYIDCFDLPNVDEEQLMDAFARIDEAVLEERNKVNGQLWSNMTMIVSDNLTMHTDFDYTDLSENPYEYSLQWKEKYLTIEKKQN